MEIFKFPRHHDVHQMKKRLHSHPKDYKFHFIGVHHHDYRLQFLCRYLDYKKIKIHA